MKFQPWEDHKNAKAPSIDISEPPCKHCAFWKPIILFDQYGDFDGVRLCHSGDMHHDFSCFTNPPETKK